MEDDCFAADEVREVVGRYAAHAVAVVHGFVVACFAANVVHAVVDLCAVREVADYLLALAVQGFVAVCFAADADHAVVGYHAVAADHGFAVVYCCYYFSYEVLPVLYWLYFHSHDYCLRGL